MTLRFPTWIACLLAVAACLFGSDAPAQDREIPTFLQLCDGTTMAGWDQPAGTTAPWKLENGLLRGTEASGGLTVEHTFGWCVWKFHWVAPPGASLNVEFPESPSGSLLTVQFGAAGHFGRIINGDRQLASGTSSIANNPAGHDAEIRIEQGIIRVAVDGKTVSTAQIPAGRRTGFAFRVTKGQADISPVLFRELGGRPIFNGRDLAGFYTDGNIESWAVQEGAIVNLKKGGRYLRTHELFGNFTFSMDYRIEKGGNSGIGIRTPVDYWPSSSGMEIQIVDEPDGRPISHETVAGIYRNMPAFRRTDRHYPDWNHVVVKADGPMISVWMNGLLVNHANLSQHSTLRYRDTLGWIGLQDHGNHIEFRNLIVVDAPPGDGFPHWSAPQSAPPGQLALGPALDPAELLTDPAATVSVVTGKHPGGDDKGGVLAELKGPGALTRIFRTNASGSVALYFDGEQQPRIETDWNQLRRRLPRIGSSDTTIYTYVPYQKSLKIVQTNSRPAAYQFSHVTYKPGTVVTSGTGPLTGDDRGWFFALAYARQHHRHGTLPFEPPQKPATTGLKEIAPGGSVVLAEATGSGRTRWLRLFSESAPALADRALWLDITIDGESQPAVSAPARLLFPAFTPENGDESAGSLIMTQTEAGKFNLLAIPFTAGLKIVARNTGKTPLKQIGLEAGINPLPAEKISPYRMRGTFQLGSSDPSAPWLAAKGTGHLVWISMDAKAQNLGALSEALIDGRQSGLSGSSLADWLGRDTPQANHNSALDGSAGPILWRHFLTDPVSFRSSLQVKLAQPQKADSGTLALYYVRPAGAKVAAK